MYSQWLFITCRSPATKEEIKNQTGPTYTIVMLWPVLNTTKTPRTLRTLMPFVALKWLDFAFMTGSLRGTATYLFWYNQLKSTDSEIFILWSHICLHHWSSILLNSWSYFVSVLQNSQQCQISQSYHLAASCFDQKLTLQRRIT